MGVSKVIYNNRTLVDLTNDTVSASVLAEGYTAHDKAGNAITGTMKPAEDTTKNVQAHIGYNTVKSSSYTGTSQGLTCNKTGVYNVSWMGWRSTNSGTSGSQLYINGKAYGSAQTTFQNTYGQYVNLQNVSIQKGQTVQLYARSRSTSYVMAVGNLIIQEV